MVSAVRGLGSQPTRTAFRSSWQNGVAERWVGSCRRDLLDHVVVLNERHLKRLMAEYMRYYHEDRTHLGLAKDTPASRPVGICPAGGKPHSIPSSTRRAAPSLRSGSVDSKAIFLVRGAQKGPGAEPPTLSPVHPLTSTRALSFLRSPSAGCIEAGTSRRTEGERWFECSPRYRTNSSSLRRTSSTY